MALHQFKQGELAYWLGVIADGKADTAEPVPQRFIDALVILRCIELDASGTPVVTDKGRLALHMGSTGPYSAS
ncbi:hypothetical protein AKI39_09345 [Bordetella sp. H567]|uniref:hypothetical protein n=1 Tax=Bordetella sp. H567 TaxID=1697043 RepID=UPI00081D2482|nr:hypothetical protein [Bordetella sp. H567]AOB33566.1 hypothetical protein AKI39_09345 [Bordetella sp. H567]